MRPPISALLLCAITLVFSLSCTQEDEWTSNVHELLIEMEDDVAILGNPLQFTDLSLGVRTRTWTFEDGVPATSNAPVVSVSFSSIGRKTCTLELVYDNGNTESQTYYVDVVQPLTGIVEVEGLSQMGAVPLEQAIQFSVTAEGDPTSYTWTFPGGHPATSNEQNPVVSWDRRGFVTAQVEIRRDVDGTSLVLEKEIHVGNYPLLVPYTTADMDSWSFDAGTRIGKWTAWNGAAGRDEVASGSVTRVSGGADGTANAMQVRYNRAGAGWELFTRDNWVNNAHLVRGSRYEFVFWMRSDVPFTLSEVIVVNQLPNWSWNELLNAHSENNWSEYFSDIPFQEQPETRLAYAANLAITTSWQRFRYEFTVGETDIQGLPVPERLLNTYPFFVVNTTEANLIYLDEVQINVIED